jgi:hypothetical protein
MHSRGPQALTDSLVSEEDSPAQSTRPPLALAGWISCSVPVGIRQLAKTGIPSGKEVSQR